MLFSVVVFFMVAAAFYGGMLLLRAGMRGQLNRPKPKIKPGTVPKLPPMLDHLPTGAPPTVTSNAPPAAAPPAAVPPVAVPPAAAPPMPPPSGPASGSGVLEASRQQAVLLRRHFPPRPGSLSHWGGVPLVPRGFTWPFLPMPEGPERALTFVLQVECAAVPAPARLGLLPDRGLLYVFLDLDWGHHWTWSVRYEDGDPATFSPAPVPASLPKAYPSPRYWGWPQREQDWPQLLPEWSIEPVLLDKQGEPSEEPEFWPGSLDVRRSLAGVEGAVVPGRYYRNQYDEGGALVRPYASYPHDWHAVRIALGHLGGQAGERHLEQHLRRGALTQEQADAFTASLREWVRHWSLRAAEAPRWAPLSREESDAFWQFVLDFQPVALYGLSNAVNEAIDATLAGSPDAAGVLPAEALELVRSRHALASQDEDRLHVNETERMLCAPSYVQGEAEQRVGEWLLLLEMSANPLIGHHWGEGVYQFWIRPDDLAARRFDRVELTASAY